MQYFSKFKTIKQLISLMLYHQKVSNLELYQSPQNTRYLSLFRFGLDMLSANKKAS